MNKIVLKICIFLIHFTFTQSKVQNFGWIHNPWKIDSENDEASLKTSLKFFDQNERYSTLTGFEMKENINKKESFKTLKRLFLDS